MTSIGSVDGLNGILQLFGSMDNSKIGELPEEQRASLANALRTFGATDVADRFGKAPAKNQKGMILVPESAGPATSPPSDVLQSLKDKKLEGYSYIGPKAQLVDFTGKEWDGEKLARVLDKQIALGGSQKKAAEELMANNGIVRIKENVYAINSERVGAVARSAKGDKKPASLASLFGGGSGVSAGALGALAGSSGVLSGSMLGSGAFVGGSLLMGLTGFNTSGLEFNIKKQLRAAAANYQDDGMISMLNNKSIPIEDLIFYFLAYMSQKYEDKLREKMEESAIAEQMERKQAARRDGARSIGGILGAVASVGGFLVGGPLGGMVGGMAGGLLQQVPEMAANKVNEVEAMVNGGAKSSTMLANEVQVLMHKWKQLTELMSNLLKSMHDMAMTPIRNIR